MSAATFDSFTTPNERAISGAMAVVTHVLFFALLVFSVSWQTRQPEAMVVDLWNNLPPVAAPKPEPAPEVKPEPPAPKPEPKPEVKPEAKPVPKAETKPAPKPEAKPPVKPDIALQEKKEKERKAAEQALTEKKKREQEEALKKLAAQQAREAEAKQQAQVAAREQEEAQAQKKLAAQRASEEAKLIEEYQRKIGDKIKRYIQDPSNLQGNPAVQFEIVIFPGGEVQGVKTVKSSGQSAWDNAVERAILKASPLPVPPPDSPIARHFRSITPVFKPRE